MEFTTTQRGARSLICLNRFVRKTAALVFVPRWFVRLVWQAVKHEAPSLPRVQEFITYHKETWLVGNYPLPLWNVFESGSVCTNNQVEGWHSRLKKVVGKAHPNIFEMTSNSISLEDYLSGVSAHTLVALYHVATITAHTYYS